MCRSKRHLLLYPYTPLLSTTILNFFEKVLKSAKQLFWRRFCKKLPLSKEKKKAAPIFSILLPYAPKCRPTPQLTPCDSQVGAGGDSLRSHVWCGFKPVLPTICSRKKNVGLITRAVTHIPGYLTFFLPLSYSGKHQMLSI